MQRAGRCRCNCGAQSVYCRCKSRRCHRNDIYCLRNARRRCQRHIFIETRQRKRAPVMASCYIKVGSHAGRVSGEIINAQYTCWPYILLFSRVVWCGVDACAHTHRVGWFICESHVLFHLNKAIISHSRVFLKVRFKNIFKYLTKLI